MQSPANTKLIHTNASIADIKARVDRLISEILDAEGADGPLYIEYTQQLNAYLSRLRRQHVAWTQVQRFLGKVLYQEVGRVNSDINDIFKRYVAASAAARAAEARARLQAAQQASPAQRINIPSPAQDRDRFDELASSAPRGAVNQWTPTPTLASRSSGSGVFQLDASSNSRASSHYSSRRSSHASAAAQAPAPTEAQVAEADRQRYRTMNAQAGMQGNPYGYSQSYNPAPPPRAGFAYPSTQSAPVGNPYGYQQFQGQHPYPAHVQQSYEGSQFLSSTGASTTGSEYTQSYYSTGGSFQGTGSWSGSG